MEGLSERGFFREEKTNEMSNIDGEEIIEYHPRPRLKENCHQFLRYGTANIDEAISFRILVLIFLYG
jgi:hypothetical protein